MKLSDSVDFVVDTAWSRTDKIAMAEAHSVEACIVLHRYGHGPDTIDTRIDVPKMQPQWAAREFVKLALALDPSVFADDDDPLTWD